MSTTIGCWLALVIHQICHGFERTTEFFCIPIVAKSAVAWRWPAADRFQSLISSFVRMSNVDFADVILAMRDVGGGAGVA
jgi:hypothetical protein